MDLNKIKELYEKGIVSYSGYQRAKILVRFNEIKGKYKTLGETYFVLSQEFNLSELSIRDIVRKCR